MLLEIFLLPASIPKTTRKTARLLHSGVLILRSLLPQLRMLSSRNLRVATAGVAGSRGWLSSIGRNAPRVLFDPHEMGTAMEAEGIEIHDSTDAPEWQSLLVAMAADILAAMR